MLSLSAGADPILITLNLLLFALKLLMLYFARVFLFPFSWVLFCL